MPLCCRCRSSFVGNNGRSFAGCMFLMSYSDWGPYIFDMFEHENWVLLCILELLKKKKWLFVVAQATFYSITYYERLGELTEARAVQISTWRPVANEHCIILPAVVIDSVLLESCREHLPGGIIQRNFESFEII